MSQFLRISMVGMNTPGLPLASLQLSDSTDENQYWCFSFSFTIISGTIVGAPYLYSLSKQLLDFLHMCDLLFHNEKGHLVCFTPLCEHISESTWFTEGHAPRKLVM